MGGRNRNRNKNVTSEGQVPRCPRHHANPRIKRTIPDPAPQGLHRPGKEL